MVTFVDKFFDGDKEAQDAATSALNSIKSGENYFQFDAASASAAYKEAGEKSGKHSKTVSQASIPMVGGAIIEYNAKSDQQDKTTPT